MRLAQNTLNYLDDLVGKKRFFGAVLVFFVLESLWITFSARYPMAFDEDFHLGVIRLYAHHLSPFWTAQPAGADVYGAVFRDPSYLYHYLMSFPYRLLAALTSNQVAQVIVLRFINIGLFAVSLVLYKKILQEIKAPSKVINLATLLFVLVPVVPQLAGQINYDNLFMPATGLSILLTIKFCRSLTSKKRIDWQLFSLLASVCMLTSLVKYAFLPIALVIAFFILVIAKQNLKIFNGPKKLTFSYKNLALAILLLVSITLFMERYGVNIAKYHTPIPDCGKVLSVQSCSKYGPWNRDYNYVLNKVDREHSPQGYIDDWFYGMWMRSFFTLDGPLGRFQTRGPLPVPSIGAIIFLVGGLLALLTKGKYIYKKYDNLSVGIVSLATVVYLAALWLDEYRAFVRTGHPVAINGRYLFPVLIFVIALMALAYFELLKNKKPLLQFGALLAVFCMMYGGGSLTFILRSNDKWYWNNQYVKDANHAVKTVLGPVTPGYDKPGEFLH